MHGRKWKTMTNNNIQQDSRACVCVHVMFFLLSLVLYLPERHRRPTHYGDGTDAYPREFGLAPELVCQTDLGFSVLAVRAQMVAIGVHVRVLDAIPFTHG